MSFFFTLFIAIVFSSTAVLGGPPPVPTELLRSFPNGRLPKVAEPRKETHFAQETIKLSLSRPFGEPLRFATLTDIHENPRRLRAAIDEIIALEPHFVVFLGDLTDLFEKEHVDRMCAQLARLRCPLLPTMGNHERMGGRYEKYLRQFGPPNYACNIENNLFIAIDGSRGFFPKSVSSWLRKTLASASKYKRRFLMCHVPARDPRPEEHHCLAPSSAKILEELCAKHKVDLVFSGHVHQSFDVKRNGVRYVSAGLIGGRVYNLPEEGGKYHFLHVTLHDDDILIDKFFLPNQLGAFAVWAGDLKMRAIYKKRLAAYSPESREYSRLAKRMVLLKSKFRRYHNRLRTAHQKSSNKKAWVQKARLDIKRQPRKLQGELAQYLEAIISSQ